MQYGLLRNFEGAFKLKSRVTFENGVLANVLAARWFDELRIEFLWVDEFQRYKRYRWVQTPELGDDQDGPTELSCEDVSAEEFQQIVTGEVSPFSLDTVFRIQERA